MKTRRRTPRTAPAVVSQWKRILAVGCSHGQFIDPVAKDAVLKFRTSFKPFTTIHLGDFLDTTCFRGGAKGTPDESEEIPPDIEHGLDFIEQLRPNLVFLGNHEDRLTKLAKHYNAIISHCAKIVYGEIERVCGKLRAEVVPYHVLDGWRDIGGFLYGHGYWYNQLAERDTAESLGNSVMAHTHKCGSARGRTRDGAICYNVGTLTRRGTMAYSCARRATMAWSSGLVWGEYNQKGSQLWLHDNGQSATWHLPVC